MSPLFSRSTTLPFLLLLLLAGTGLAQEKDQPLPPKDPDAARIAAAIQALSKAVEGDQALKEEERKALIDSLAKGLDLLRESQEWRAREAKLVREKAGAAEELSRIRKALDSPPPDPPAAPGGSLAPAALEEKLRSERSDLDKAKREKEEARKEKDARAKRREKLPAELQAATKRLAELDQEKKAFEGAEKKGTRAEEAGGILLEARRHLALAEVAALGTEGETYAATGDLTAARLELATRKAAILEKRVEALERAYEESRSREAEETSRKARETVAKADLSHPAHRRVAEETARLAERRTGSRGLLALAQEAGERLRDIQSKREKLEADFQSVKGRVDRVGLTVSMGLFLRKKRADLPSLRDHRGALRNRRDTIEKAQWELIGLEEQRGRLAHPEERAREILGSTAGGSETEKRLALLLREKRKVLDEIIKDANAYFTTLADLDAEERELLSMGETYASYIDERVLWVRSAQVLSVEDGSRAGAFLGQLFRPDSWADLGGSLWTGLGSGWLPTAAGLLLLAVLVFFRRRAVRGLAGLAGRPEPAPWRSLEGLLLTVILAAPAPVLLLFAGWRVAATGTAPLGPAVASGLLAAGAVLAGIELLRQLLRPSGLGTGVWDWPGDGYRFLRKNLAWLAAVAAPVVFLGAAAGTMEQEGGAESLGRFAFVAGFSALALFLGIAARPGGPLLGPWLAGRSRAAQLRNFWYPAIVAAPLALVALSAAGYHYSAVQVSHRLHGTAWIVACLLLLHRALTDAVLGLHARAAARRAKNGGEEGGENEPGTQPGLSVPEAASRIGRLGRYTAAVLILTGLWLTWVDMVPALGALKRVELWSTTAKVTETAKAADGQEVARTVEKVVPVTLDRVFVALFILGLAVAGARSLPEILSAGLLQRFTQDGGLLYAVKTILAYVLGFVGAAVAFSTLGLSWASLQWLVAAMGVGLGFGLQEIFANFVSGIILLFERPIRVGDTVTVGGVSGEVTRIRMRATTVRDWDRKELVIPNKQFITGELVNWTLSDKLLRVIVPVGVAYGSDTDLTHELLLKVAKETPHVLSDPRPKALFLGFGASSLDFELRVFVPHIDHLIKVKDLLHTAIDKAFRQANVEIAFPQHDLHLRSVDPEVRLPGDSSRSAED